MSEEKNEEVEILDEYDFSNAVIGKYAKQYAEGTNIVVLEPDVAKVFPDSAAVNQALRQLIEQRSRYFRVASKVVFTRLVCNTSLIKVTPTSHWNTVLAVSHS